MALRVTEFVEGWDYIQTLGEGAYGEVQLVVNQISQEAVAVKVINVDETPTAAENIRREVCIHRMLKHPNIIKFFGQRIEESRQYIFIEYAAGGELFDRIDPDIGMPEIEAQKFFKQLIDGVEYLHGRGLTHRDLKPENLLVDEHENLKISDFGMATMFRYQGKEARLSKRCGTLPYVAPEVLLKEYYAEPADIWSCGVILVALVAGELPWDKPTYDCREYRDWKECRIQNYPWTKINNLILTLLRKILMPSPTKRYTMTQIKNHQWFIKNLKPKIPQQGFNAGSSLGTPCKRFRSDCEALDIAAASAAGQEKPALRLSASQPDPLPVGAPKLSGQSQPSTDAAPTRAVSFSQPTHPENLLLNSQMLATASTPNSASQSPLQRLVKRMTRFFVKTDLKQTMKELRTTLLKMNYQLKDGEYAQLTIITKDKRNANLIFKAVLLEMNNNILVDFRLSKGDGLEFKRHFLRVKEKLVDIIAKGPVTWPIAIATNTLP